MGKIRNVYEKLMEDFKEIESGDNNFTEKTDYLLPSESTLLKVKGLVYNLQSLYSDSDECYLVYLPEGSVKLRFSKGRRSCDLYVSENYIHLIILDYIDELFCKELPINIPTQKLVEICTKHFKFEK